MDSGRGHPGHAGSTFELPYTITRQPGPRREPRPGTGHLLATSPTQTTAGTPSRPS